MTTRAVLLTSSGTVHRVIVGGDRADQTKCGQPYSTQWTPISPKQALVFTLQHCLHQWQRFKEGIGT